MISDTASYSDDIFTLHFVIMSCIAICAFPRSPHDLLSNEPMIDDTVYLIIRFWFLLFSRATVMIGPKVKLFVVSRVAAISDFGLHDGTTNRSQRHVANFLLVLGL